VSLSGTCFDVKTRQGHYNRLYTPLIGRHQGINAAVAISLAEIAGYRHGLRIYKSHIRKGLKGVAFPARFQICSRNPYMVLDGAHNQASAEALKNTVTEVFKKKDISLIFGVASDKDYNKMAEILFPMARWVIFTQFDSPRALPALMLAQKTGILSKRHFLCYSVKDAMVFAKSITPRDGVIIATGSLFVAGEALKILRDKNIKGKSGE
jgi:dihydrofolate synthase / folylpolyglutamate synthase